MLNVYKVIAKAGEVEGWGEGRGGIERGESREGRGVEDRGEFAIVKSKKNCLLYFRRSLDLTD